jgi:T3SS (YopN, CesT) and YbjN peptide-binding chaperone 3
MGSNSLSKSATVDLDRSTTKAWRRFRRELGDRIADLGAGEVFGVAVESAVDEPGSGGAPYLQFRRDESDSVLGEVSGNRNPHAAHRLDKQARRRLAEIGWSRPRQKHGPFQAEVRESHADQLAVMAVAALREVFGVTHPAFLVGDVRIEDDPDLPTVASTSTSLSTVPCSHCWVSRRIGMMTATFLS